MLVTSWGRERMVDMPNQNLTAAPGYLARGWSVVPVAERGKRPIVRWQTFGERYPTEAEVRDWFERWPTANVAVVTGLISGVVVLDVDPSHGGEESLARLALRNAGLPRTVEATTGGGGRHVYFKHPGFEVRNRTGFFPGLDLRGDGGVIIVPPSIHPWGRPYRWLKGLRRMRSRSRPCQTGFLRRGLGVLGRDTRCRIGAILLHPLRRDSRTLTSAIGPTRTRVRSRADAR